MYTVLLENSETSMKLQDTSLNSAQDKKKQKMQNVVHERGWGGGRYNLILEWKIPTIILQFKYQ